MRLPRGGVPRWTSVCARTRLGAWLRPPVVGRAGICGGPRCGRVVSTAERADSRGRLSALAATQLKESLPLRIEHQVEAGTIRPDVIVQLEVALGRLACRALVAQPLADAPGAIVL